MQPEALASRNDVFTKINLAFLGFQDSTFSIKLRVMALPGRTIRDRYWPIEVPLMAKAGELHSFHSISLWLGFQRYS
jgi:hypothetical protein